MPDDSWLPAVGVELLSTLAYFLTDIDGDDRVDIRRIGVLVVSSDSVAEMDLKNLLPREVPFFTARLYHDDSTPRGVPTLDAIVDGIDAGIRTIMQVEPELMVFACTSGSFYKGKGWEETLTREISAKAGVPALVTSAAVLMALRTLRAKKLFMMTPYPQSLNTLETNFFEDYGFEFVHSMRIETALAKDIGNVPPGAIIEALEPHREKIAAADTLLLSCTALRAVDVIDEIEQRFGKPVVSSNQATAWAVLKALNVNPGLSAGRLFST